MFDRGYVTVARWRGTPIRIHWSTPIGMLLFGRFQLVPGFWLGYLLLIALHEMGHAFFSRRVGLHATSIEIHALGGQCRYRGESVSPWQRAVVAWGGVVAQAVVLAIALVVFTLAPPTSAFLAQLESALVWTNLWLMALNLMPLPPLDGAEAWKLFGLWRARRGRKRARDARDRVEVRVRAPKRAGEGPLDLGDVDHEAVRDTVRRALDDAAKQSRPRRDPR